MQNQNNEYTIIDLFGNIKIIWKFFISKIISIIIFAALCGIIGFIIRLYIGTTYKAEMSFVAENGSGDKIGGYASIAAQFGIDLGQSGGGAFEGDNLMEVFKSRKLIVATLLSKGDIGSNYLIEDYIENYKLNKHWSSKPHMKNLKFSDNITIPNRVRDSVLNMVYESIIKGHLSIDKRDKKLNFITLEFQDKNEQFAKTFTENLSTNAITFYTDYKTKKATLNLKLLQSQCDSIKNLLSGSITDAAVVSDLNLNPIKQTLRSNTQKKQIDIQANTAMYIEILKQLAIAKITLQKETPLIQIIDSPILPLKKISMGKLVTAILFAVFGGILISIYFGLIFFAKNTNPNIKD